MTNKSGIIYLIQDDQTLQPMEEHPYSDEDLLQTLLEKYPDLLAGEQMDETSPRRWLLISREFGIPCEEEGGERWSLDHLFLDQDGIPTLVEVKRSTDTRIRREVVGQMMDYAANAVVYWPIEKIQDKFKAACEENGNDPIHQICDLVDDDSFDEDTAAAFWEKVKTNLQARRIRMVFVADEIPSELRRIVEFLNEQMNPAEVFAVEVRQFVGEGVKTLVPRLVGQTATAQRAKSSRSSTERQWDMDSFMAELESKHDVEVAHVARSIHDWIVPMADYPYWGKGAKFGSFIPVFICGKTKYYLFQLWTDGSAQIRFSNLKSKPPFQAEEKRKEYWTRLNHITGIDLPETSIWGHPSIPLSKLTTPGALQQFKKAIEWAIQEVKTQATGS